MKAPAFFFWMILWAAASLRANTDSLRALEQRSANDKEKLRLSLLIIEDQLANDDSTGLRERIARTETLCRYNDDVAIYYLQSAKGGLQFLAHNNQLAFSEYYRALTLARALGRDSILAHAYATLGHKYFYIDNYDVALPNLLKAKDYFLKAGMENQAAMIDRECGIMHQTLGSWQEALRLYEEARAFWEKHSNKKDLAAVLNNIGILYTTRHDSLQAITHLLASLKLREETGDLKGQGQAYNNIGNMFYELGHYNEALDYFKKGYDYRQRGHIRKSGLIESGINIGKALYKKKNISEALHWLEKSLNECGTDPDFIELKMHALQHLKDVYYDAGNLDRSIRSEREYQTIKDSLFNREKTEQLVKTSLSVEYGRRMMEDSLRNAEKEKQALIEKQKEDAVRDEKDKRQRLFVGVLIAGILVLLGIAFLLYKRNEEKKTTNSIITLQRDELKTKQQEITDSINYAKRIQEAILPPKELKRKLFPDSFVLFLPRDIVSGDFYWFAEKNERKLIAAVDCTGHGVPGAFMSMIGNAFLNEIVNERGIVEPHTVLDHLRNNVVKSMRQTGAEGENKDGMDIALCAFDEKQMMLEFSGANNPLWLFRNGELKEFAGDKQPIGVQTGRQDPFTLQKVPLQKGDRIYIFTDGYADQFGGPKGKKFKYKQLQQLLINMEGSPMSEQEKDLQHELEKWKGELEQVDDILVIGIRI